MGRFSCVFSSTAVRSVSPGLPSRSMRLVSISTLGGGVRPSASKYCCTAPRPDAAGPCTGYFQPLDLYHSATAPLSKRRAASLGLALAFSATWRGERDPPKTPGGDVLTGTSARTTTVAVPPFLSMTRADSAALVLALQLSEPSCQV